MEMMRAMGYPDTTGKKNGVTLFLVVERWYTYLGKEGEQGLGNQETTTLTLMELKGAKR